MKTGPAPFFGSLQAVEKGIFRPFVAGIPALKSVEMDIERHPLRPKGILDTVFNSLLV
jgi:hypothetical protein